jgi:hypothetical protein
MTADSVAWAATRQAGQRIGGRDREHAHEHTTAGSQDVAARHPAREPARDRVEPAFGHAAHSYST